MGYSTPKKPFDLKEFLSTPAKKRGFARKFGAAKSPVPAPAGEAEGKPMPKPESKSKSKPGDAPR